MTYLAHTTPMPGDWLDGALCAQVDTAIFFPAKGESSMPAKRVCAKCEVRPQCLEYALENRIHYGVWGGISYSRAIKHARLKGWVPPLAWDDDTIDDPEAQPDGADHGNRPGRPGTLPPADEVLWLLEQGESKASIAQRFRVTVNSVEQAIFRGRRTV